MFSSPLRSCSRDADRIPTEAVPRGDLGVVANLGFFAKWCCSPKLVIRESIGDSVQKLAWQGAVVNPLRKDQQNDHLLRDSILSHRFPAALPDTHRGVLSDINIPQAAQESINALNVQVHNVYEVGTGDYNIDEYCVILDELPPQFPTPDAFLAGYLRDPNGFANDRTFSMKNPGRILRDFDTFNSFQLKLAGTKENWSDRSRVPGVGDWYHIEIPGNDGDVVIVDTQVGGKRWSATVATLTDSEIGPMKNHPVSGRRQFGIEELHDGSYRVYTRGFDRQTNVFMDLQVGNMAQNLSWTCLMRALAAEHGGRPERYDEGGKEIWGWVRQIPVEVLLSSLEV